LIDHEHWSGRLIRETEIAGVLREVTTGYAEDVADIIGRGHPQNMYEAVVSSQFDADRLDYMQRDRLMTGTQHGAIDFAWLLANIEVGSVPRGVDDDSFVENVETFVLGPKAVSAAETYVLGLLHLYQTVYFHKATRGAEKLFTELLLKIFASVGDNGIPRTGLPETHALVRFALAPGDLDAYLSLDDSVVWGALPMLAQATNPVIAELATRLRDRKLYRCLDVKELAARESKPPGDERQMEKSCVRILDKLRGWVADHPDACHRLLIDRADRLPYRRLDESKGPLNQIRIRSALSSDLVDIESRSAVVNAIPVFKIWRVYIPRDDDNLLKLVQQTVREVLDEQPN
jgi:HD superfamily phosphohydrolase